MKRDLGFVKELSEIKKLNKEDVLDVELELTGTCNLDCPLCTRSNKSAKHLLTYNERSYEEITKQLDEYPNIESCCLAGIISEPTMHRDFIRIVEYLVGRDIKIELYSNTSIHTPQYWAKLAKVFKPHDKIFFTVCGSTQELHEKYRIGSSLEKVLRNHQAFKEACPYDIDYIQHIRFEYNAEDFESPEMQEIISRFSHTDNIDTCAYNERFGLIEGDENDIKLIKSLARNYALISKNGKQRFEDHNEGKKKCYMRCKSLETRSVAFDQYGNTFPCFLYRMYNTDEKFDLNYEKINNFEYDFCYECEELTTFLLENSGLERMV